VAAVAAAAAQQLHAPPPPHAPSQAAASALAARPLRPGLTPHPRRCSGAGVADAGVDGGAPASGKERKLVSEVGGPERLENARTRQRRSTQRRPTIAAPCCACACRQSTQTLTALARRGRRHGLDDD